LVLGYSSKAVAVVAELAQALASASASAQGGAEGCIVVLADHPCKQDFDAQVAARLHPLGLHGRIRVVFRRGAPWCQAHLAKVAPGASRSIVVLSDTREGPARADALVLNVASCAS
jgi:hypothetical protein